LHVLSTASYAKKIKKIIINTDCLNVIHLINNDKRKIQKYNLASWGRYLVFRYEDMLRVLKISPKNVEVRHVRSHISTESKKEWVNDWCDRAAKEAMAIAIKEKIKTSISKDNI
jgi:hypothetical protein